jgi:hypothetical protein
VAASLIPSVAKKLDLCAVVEHSVGNGNRELKGEELTSESTCFRFPAELHLRYRNIYITLVDAETDAGVGYF